MQPLVIAPSSAFCPTPAYMPLYGIIWMCCKTLYDRGCLCGHDKQTVVKDPEEGPTQDSLQSCATRRQSWPPVPAEEKPAGGAFQPL